MQTAGIGTVVEVQRECEVAEGLNVDLDVNGDVVGFDIDNASERVELSTLETRALPVLAS